MNKKEEQKIEKEINAIFKKIEEVEKKGKFLFADMDSKYWKFDNKYYSIPKHYTEDGDVWCEELKLEEVKKYLENAKKDNQHDIERVITNVRLNTLLIAEEYDNKIKLMGVKL